MGRISFLAPKLGWEDDFTDDTWWWNFNAGVVGAFTPNGYEVSGYISGSSITLESGHVEEYEDKFLITGDWEVILDFDIDSIVGTPDDEQAFITFILGQEGSDESSFVTFQGDGSGALNANAAADGAGEDNWLGAGFGTGSHRIRMKLDDATGEVTVWIWTGSQWEWDGDTDGWTADTSGGWSNDDAIHINIHMGGDSATNYITSTMTLFTLVTGEIYEEPAATWRSHYDADDFSAYLGSWDGFDEEWDSEYDDYEPGYEAHVVSLDTDGVWPEGYRPTKARITYTGSDDLDVIVGHDDVRGTPIATGEHASGAEIDLDWSAGEDMTYVVLSNYEENAFSVTNIEWLGGTEGTGGGGGP